MSSVGCSVNISEHPAMLDRDEDDEDAGQQSLSVKFDSLMESLRRSVHGYDACAG